MSLSILQSIIRDGAQNPMDGHIEDCRKHFTCVTPFPKLAQVNIKKDPLCHNFSQWMKRRIGGPHSFFHLWRPCGLQHWWSCLESTSADPNPQPELLHLPHFLIFCSKWTQDVGKWKRICWEWEMTDVYLSTHKQTSNKERLTWEH